MKIRVELFGTLPKRFPDYDPATGMEIEMPEGASVGDLLARLHISSRESGVVAMEGKVAGPADPLREGVSVRVLQQVHGG